MTFREKLQQEHPEYVNPAYEGGVIGCPYKYGYEKLQVSNMPCRGDSHAHNKANKMCEKCWNREFPETKMDATLVETEIESTGFIRHVDDLGRIVIPRKVRDKLQIHENDLLEYFVTNSGEVILRKYSPLINEVGVDFIKKYVEDLSERIGCRIIITDRNCIIASANSVNGPFNLLDGLEISNEFKTELLKDDRTVNSSIKVLKDASVPLTNGCKINYSQCIYEAIKNYENEVVGSIIFYAMDVTDCLDCDKHKIINGAAKFLAKQLD